MIFNSANEVAKEELPDPVGEPVRHRTRTYPYGLSLITAFSMHGGICRNVEEIPLIDMDEKNTDRGSEQ